MIQILNCDFCPSEAIVMDKDGFIYCNTCAEKNIFHDPFIAEKKEFIYTIVKARRFFKRLIKNYPRSEQKRLKELFQQRVNELEEVFDVTCYIPSIEEFLVV